MLYALSVALSSVVAGAVCYGVAALLAHSFPSKDMLDAEAVDQEWTVPDDEQSHR